jgi:chemotaxis signal transduction protein
MMNGKNQILICKICDYSVGFEVKFVNQIIQTGHAKVSAKSGMIIIHDKKLPYINIFHLFRCKENNSKFALILNYEKRLFGISVSEIEGIISIESDTDIHSVDGLKDFVMNDYAKKVIIHNETPIIVIDIKKVIDKDMEKIG